MIYIFVIVLITVKLYIHTKHNPVIPEYKPNPVEIPNYSEAEYRQHEIWISQIDTMTTEISTLYNKAEALRKEANRVIQTDKDGTNPIYKYQDTKRYTMIDNALKCELKAYTLIEKRDKLKDKLYIDEFN